MRKKTDPAEPASDALATRAHVRTAWRMTSAAHLSESALFATTAMVLTQAAGILSGVPLGGAVFWGTGLVSAACAGLSWWRETRVGPAAVARRLDRKSAAGGALLAAWECALHPAPSPVARLLMADVRRRYVAREHVRRALPRSLPFVALPFFAAALLAVALERTRREREDPSLTGVIEGVAAGVADLRAGLDDRRLPVLSPEMRSEILRLSAKAESLRRRIAEASAREQQEIQAEVQDLAGDLRKLAPELDATRARYVAEARSAADAARLGEARPAGGWGGEPPDSAPEPVEEGEGVTSAASSGTMSGRSTPETTLPTGGAGAAEERGVTAGRWWSAHHDGVVARWLELQQR